MHRPQGVPPVFLVESAMFNKGHPAWEGERKEIAVAKAQLVKDAINRREPNPTQSVKQWCAGTWAPSKVKNKQDNITKVPFTKGMSSQEKARFQVAQMLNLRNIACGHAKEDKDVVGYVPDVFFRSPNFKNAFSLYQGSFILTHGNQKEVIAICLFTRFQDMDSQTQQDLEFVTKTFQSIEKVRYPFKTNGALVKGKMSLCESAQNSRR
ncbi:uncharacterized protein PGTG_18655 [Puccinia graminis f. sp. tritici CRL 75-36-700-3]|uniref:Uncharacterized protein n=1 Tax=Puccinia graminis f. sp. tritici (strain CRL 75-36-700-3 / race SCCL) TaxID=418459 RepID=E3L896_PUCGT|nr:uncharacterized protein PGTG_18655 [Puccinia graminis f. sp. tritici CRL 75-36-700-3]EFP92771.2 hypothetical protein PGTG_18655 [Puccinia graminis f. sp. tritici CRL 75-36-700-3]